jgi:hypothetical protein
MPHFTGYINEIRRYFAAQLPRRRRFGSGDDVVEGGVRDVREPEVAGAISIRKLGVIDAE